MIPKEIKDHLYCTTLHHKIYTFANNVEPNETALDRAVSLVSALFAIRIGCVNDIHICNNAYF